MKRFLSAILAVMMLIASITAVNVCAADLTIEKWSEIGDMENTNAKSYFGTRLSQATFGSVSSLSFENGAGIDGSTAAVVTKTADVGGTYAGSLKSDRFTMSGNKISFKAGYTYYFSAMVKSDSKDATFSPAVEKTSGDFSWSVKIGSPTPGGNSLTTTAPGGTAAAVSGATDWKRLIWSVAVESVTGADGSSLTETGYYFIDYINIAGGSNITTELKSDKYPVKAYIDDKYIIEVPADDTKAVVKPVVYGVEVASSGSTLSASAVSYDVNPNVTPEISYNWQEKSGDKWVDISGANEFKYTFSDSANGKILRCKVTAESTTSSGTKISDIAYSGECTVDGEVGYLPDTESTIYKTSLIGDMEDVDAPSSFKADFGTFTVENGAGIDGSKAAVITRNSKRPASSALQNDKFSYASQVNIKNGYTYYFSAMVKSTSLTYSAFGLGGSLSINSTPTYADGSGSGKGTAPNWRGLHVTPPYGGAEGWDYSKWNRITGMHKVTGVRDGGGNSIAQTGNTYNLYIPFGASTIAGGSMNGSVDYEEFPQTTVIDDFYVLEVPTADLKADAIPVAYGAEISGEFKKGQTLTASAVCYDVNPNITPSLKFVWQRFGNSDWSDIADGKTYVVKNEDIGYKLRVKAVAESTTEYGTVKTDSAFSAAVETTEVSGFAPQAKNLSVIGKVATDETIEGTYEYFDGDGDEESGTTFEWFRADAEEGEYTTTGVKTKTYKLSDADINKYLKFTVTPKNAAIPEGGLVAELIIPGPVAPEAKNVTITGEGSLGNMLTGTFEYFDANASEAGAHEYSWYKADTENGEKTKLAPESNTLLVTSDLVDKYVFFGVVPKSTDKPEAGTITYSKPVLIGKKLQNTVFVAVNGDDSNGDGSIEKPFATLERAKQAVGELKVRPDGGITVYFREGTYPVTKTVEFSAADSGSSECPIVYRAYKDEKVTFSAAKKLDFSKFNPVSGEMRDKLIDETARSKVVVADFADIGLSDYKGIGITKAGNGVDFGTVDVPLMEYNGEIMKVSRYPNNEKRSEWCVVKSVSENEKTFTMDYSSVSRVDKWTHNEDYIMSMGFFALDWFAEVHFFDFDRDAKTMTSKSDGYYLGIDTVGADEEVFFLNIYEEIDMPGEWYADEVNKKLYMYPLSDDTDPDITITSGEHIFFDFDHTKHVKFHGIEMTGGNSAFVKASAVDSVVFDSCDIHMFKGGIGEVYGAKNTGFKNAEIYHFSSGGLKINGGDPKTLVPSNNFFTNNYAHDFSVNCQAYGAVLWLANGCVGMKVDHNEFANAPHMVMQYTSYNNIIEYNVFHDVVVNSADMGAIYSTRKFDQMGNKFRYNHFYRIGDPNHRTSFTGHAFFPDDGTSGDEFYGNVLGPYGANMNPLKIHGGMAHKIYNNLIIDCTSAVIEDGNWYKIWWDCVITNDLTQNPTEFSGGSYRAAQLPSLVSSMAEVFKNDIVMEAFPWVKQVRDDMAFVKNTFTRNVMVFVDTDMPSGWNPKVPASGWYYKRFGSEPTDMIGLKYNMFIDSDKGEAQFADYANGDYTLDHNSEIFEKMPDFEPIPFSEIGRFEVNGQAPSAKDIKIVGNLEYSNTLSGFYKYLDAEADTESGSKYRWLVSDTENGVYTELEGETGNTLTVTDALSGKYVKFEVTVGDETGRRGQPALSEGFFVLIDDGSLGVLIEATEGILANAKAGSGLGEYSQTAIDALKASVDSAKTAVDKSAAAQDIAEKTEALIASRVLETTALGTVTIPADMPSATVNMGDISEGAVIEFADENCGWLTINGTINGKSVSVKIPGGYKIAGNKLEIKPDVTTDAAVYGEFYLVLGIGSVGDELNASVTAEGSETLTAVYTPGLNRIKIIGNDCSFPADKGGEYAILKPGKASDDTTLASISVNGEAIKGSMNRDSFNYLTDSDIAPVVTAVATAPRAKVEITQAASVPGTATVVVTAEDGTVKRYSVKFVLKNNDSEDDASDAPSGSGGGNYTPSVGGASGSNGFFISSSTTAGYNASNNFVFDDMKDHWAKTDVMNMYNAGIVSGATEKTFEPERNITRAEFATLISRALKLEEAESDFADVGDEWFAPFVGAAAKAGIIVGSDGYFRPNDTITRQEMAVIVVKAYEYLEKTAESAELTFSDNDEIADWATDYIAKAVGAKLISGMGDGRFAPADNATRAQAVSIISRIIK